MNDRILRGESLPPLRKPVFPAVRSEPASSSRPEPVDAEREAAQIKKKAEEDAGKMIARAAEHAEAAYRGAYEQGRTEALAHYRRDFKEALEHLAGMREALERLPAEWAVLYEKDLVRLAVRIAEKVIHRELRLDPDAVVDVVRAALKAQPDRRTVIVEVHPNDFERIRRVQRVLAPASRDGLALQVSSEIEPGGCRVLSDAGVVNANPVQQLDQIRRSLEGGAA